MVDNLESLLGPDTCRLCLKSGRSPTPVSNENLKGSLMAIKIDILTSVKVAPSDKVCPMCRINVKNFYDFRIMCVQSDARIKGFQLKAGNSAAQDDLSVTKTDHVVRSYKRVRRTTAEADKLASEASKSSDNVPDTIDLFKSTADLFKSKAESGNSRGLFKLKTKPVLRPDDVFKGFKRPLIITQKPSTSTETPDSSEKTDKLPTKSEDEDDPLFTDDAEMRGDDDSFVATEEQSPTIPSVYHLMDTDSDDPDAAGHLSPAMESNPPPLVPISSSVESRKCLSSAIDPLSSASDPLASVSDPLSSSSDPLSTATGPLSPEEEPINITVEPLSPARKDDEDSVEEKTCRPGEMIVKIENTLDDESISDNQSDHNDNVESDVESETEIDANDKHGNGSSSKSSIFPKIKKEITDDESAEEPDDTKPKIESRARQEIMEEIDLKPEEVIIPELKREPEDLLFMDAEFDDEDNYPEESPSFSGDPVSKFKEEPKRPRNDTESLEVLVDPLMLMDEDHDAQMENKLSRLSPVLGNGMSSMPNGKLPLPPLNGARSDKQRGLDFVKKLLKKPGDDSPGSTESPDKPYRCASCNLTFAYYKSYVKHKDRHLGVLSTFPCNLCPAIFSTNRELNIHMRKHVEKTFSCDRCYRSFPTRERLQSHHSLHTGDKQHTCDICMKAFAYKSSVVLHMRKMHGDVITGGSFLRCPKCPTEWNTSQELKQHMEMHEGDGTERKTFSCGICSMIFPSKSILNVHARIHLKSK